MLSQWFSVYGRVNRREYFSRMGLLLVVLAVGFWSLFEAVSRNSFRFGGLGVLILLLVGASMLSLVVRRLHDLELSGWWVGALVALAAMSGSRSLFRVLVSLWVTPLVLVIVVLGLIPGKSGTASFDPELGEDGNPDE